MGEGLYWHADGHTAYAEPAGDLDPSDPDELGWAYEMFCADIRDLLTPAWWRVDRAWRDRSSRVLACNRLHEIWLNEDSYGRVHVTFGVREHLYETDALARHWLSARAGAFFDALGELHPLRVRTSAWTSAPRIGRTAAA